MYLLFNKCLSLFICFMLIVGQLFMAGPSVYAGEKKFVNSLEAGLLDSSTLSPESLLDKGGDTLKGLFEDRQLRKTAKENSPKGAIAKLLLKFRGKKEAQAVLNSPNKNVAKKIYQKINNKFLTFRYLQIPLMLMAIFPNVASAQETFTPKEFISPPAIVKQATAKSTSTLKAADYTKSAESISIDILSDELLGESTKLRPFKKTSSLKSSATAQTSSIYSFPDVIPADLVLEVDTAKRRAWVSDNLLPVFARATQNFATMSDNDKREFFKELSSLLANPDFKTILGSYPSWDNYLGQDLIDSLYFYARDLTKLGMDAGQSKLINGWALIARLQGLKGFFKVKAELAGYDDDFKNNPDFKEAIDNELDYYPQQTDRDLREYIAISIADGGQYNDYKVISSELYRSFEKKEAVIADISAMVRDLGHRNIHLQDVMKDILNNLIAISSRILQYSDDTSVRDENITHVATLMKALRDFTPVLPDTGMHSEFVKDLKVNTGMRFMEYFVFNEKAPLSFSEKEHFANQLELVPIQKELFLDYNLLAFAYNQEIDGKDGNRRFREHEFAYMKQLQSFLWETEHMYEGISGVVGNSRYVLVNESGGTYAYVPAGLPPFMGMPVGNSNISFEVLFHEAGHIVDGMLDAHGDMQSRIHQVFKRSDDRNDFITDYAQTNSGEDLAEMFRYWMIDSRALIKEAVKRKSEGNSALFDKVLVIADLFAVQNETDKVFFLTCNEDEMKYEAFEIERDADGSITEESLLNHIPSVEQIEVEAKGFVVDHPYPSPFGTTTTIPISTIGSSRVTVEVYNTMGQKIEQIFDEDVFTGKQNIRWTPKNLADGVYLIRVTQQKSGKLTTSFTKKVMYDKGLHRFSLKGLFAPLALFSLIPALVAAAFHTWGSGSDFNDMLSTVLTTITSYPAFVTVGMFFMTITSALKIPLSKRVYIADDKQLREESIWIEDNNISPDNFYRLSKRIRKDLIDGELLSVDMFNRFSLAQGKLINVENLSMLPKFFQDIIIYIHEPVPSHFKGIIAMIPGFGFLAEKEETSDVDRYVKGLDIFEAELGRELWGKGVATKENWELIKMLLTRETKDVIETLDIASKILSLAKNQNILLNNITFKKFLAKKMIVAQQTTEKTHGNLHSYMYAALVKQSA